MLTETPATLISHPDSEIAVRDAFGIESDLMVPAFSDPADLVPAVEETYRFDRDTTLAILAGSPITAAF